MGFLRIVTNRSFSPNVPTWTEAITVLGKHTEGSSTHSFWHDSLTLAEIDLMLGSRIKGPNQIADAYLLAMAIRRKGRFVTFDSRMQSLAQEESREYDALVILRPDPRPS